MVISGWGRVQLNRGTGKGDLDQIEDELLTCHQQFADAVTPLGISATDPQAWDLLLERAAEHRLRKPELVKKKNELKLLAPEGLAAINAKVVKLRTQLADVPTTDPTDIEPLPAEQGELDRLATNLKQQLSVKGKEIITLEANDKEAETALTTIRQEEATAREELATCKATANSRREELHRLRSDEQIDQSVALANLAVAEAKSHMKQTELTNDECTIDERLAGVKEAVSALETGIRENAEKFNTIKGRLIASEGLHAQRSSIAARVDELRRVTERESLEKDATDRLYALFEECREKQLGTLMGPIHDRVLGWMRVLDIGDYKEVRFNDAFLPDKLMSRDGTAEFTVAEESTGAEELIGMLVRLGLGSILASASEPAVAILDDPLTHCDIRTSQQVCASYLRALLRATQT